MNKIKGLPTKEFEKLPMVEAHCMIIEDENGINEKAFISKSRIKLTKVLKDYPGWNIKRIWTNQAFDSLWADENHIHCGFMSWGTFIK
jgi:hypothetical protein